MSETASPIDGEWLPFQAELAGENPPGLVLARTEVAFRAGRYTVRFDREIADQGSFVTGANTPHATLTLTGIKGHNAGRTIPAIYQVRGDRLRICYGLDGTLPLSFAAGVGTRFYLVTYRRKP